jgi:hypothetical protein
LVIHSYDLHERVVEVRPVRETRLHDRRAVYELHHHVEHLGGEVAVREPPAPERATALRLDTDRGPAHERLQPDRGLDGSGEGPGGPVRHGDPEILMEDASELDAGFEEKGLPTR